MDLDNAFVSALLSEGTEGWRTAVEKGIRATDLTGNGRLAYDYASEHLQTYGTLPQLDVVEGRLGLALGVPQGKLIYFADEINNRKLHGAIQTGVSKIVSTLRDAKPQDAFIEIENLLSRLRNEQVVGSRVRSWGETVKDAWAFYERIKAGETGVLTPWASINEATLGFWPQDLVVVAARQGVGKCVKFDTLLMDPVSGLLSTIEELYRNDAVKLVPAWSRSGGVRASAIEAKHDTGTKQCLRFDLGSGRSLSVTPEHPFITPDGDKRAEELRPGWTVGLPSRLPLPTNPELLPEEELDFLAIMLADGACTSSDVRFTKHDPEIVRLGERASVYFGTRFVSCDAGNDWRFSRMPGVLKNPARELLRAHALDGVLSKNKTLPDAIYKLNASQLARFLTVFWMCDGYTDSAPGITLASESLVRGIQHLLLRLGIQSSVHYKQARNGDGVFDAWRLRVYSHCVVSFSEQLPLWGNKGVRLRSLLTTRRNANVGFPRVSAQLRQRILAVAGKAAGRGTSPVRSEACARIAAAAGRRCFYPRDLFQAHGDCYSLMVDLFRLYCAEFGCTEEYRWLWDSDVFWDTVKTVTDEGEQKIYDLTVPETSYFIANDVIVHNTWFAIIIALNAWMNGRKVLFATTEMAQVAVSMRLLALYNRISIGEFRHGRLGMHTEGKVLQSIDDLQGSKGFWIIGGDFDFRTESLEAAMEEVEPDLTIADGAYLMDTAEGGNTRTEKAAATFNALKRTAKRRNSVVMATTQFNRTASNEKASSIKLENVGLTDVIGWNADLAFGLVQTEDMRTDKKMAIKPLKVREGVGKDLTVEWNMDSMDFREIQADTPEADEFSTGVSMPPGAQVSFSDSESGNLF